MNSKHRFTWAVLIAVCLAHSTPLWAGPQPAANRPLAAPAAAPLDLSALVADVLERNPELLALAQQVSALRARVPQVGTLEDPKLELTVSNLPVTSWNFTTDPMTSKMVSISQMFPFPGKLALRQEIASLEAQMLEQQLANRRNELARDAKRAYWELYYLARAIGISRRMMDFPSGSAARP